MIVLKVKYGKKNSTAAKRNFKQSTTLICVEIFCTWVGRFLRISRFYMNSTWLVVEQALVQWTTQYSIEFKLAFWTLLHLDTVANDIAWFYITVIHSHSKRFFKSNLNYWKYCYNILDKVISSISSLLLKNKLVMTHESLLVTSSKYNLRFFQLRNWLDLKSTSQVGSTGLFRNPEATH